MENFRLVTIVPGTEADPLRYSISQSNRVSSEYEALSYTWGDERKKSAVYCDDSQSPNYITANCAQALRRLRRAAKERVIWIDSLCINQNDLEERTRQVQLMPLIYSSASQVLIYVGEPEND